jgi:hypothetical protein
MKTTNSTLSRKKQSPTTATKQHEGDAKSWIAPAKGVYRLVSSRTIDGRRWQSKRQTETPNIIGHASPGQPPVHTPNLQCSKRAKAAWGHEHAINLDHPNSPTSLSFRKPKGAPFALLKTLTPVRRRSHARLLGRPCSILFVFFLIHCRIVAASLIWATHRKCRPPRRNAHSHQSRRPIRRHSSLGSPCHTPPSLPAPGSVARCDIHPCNTAGSAPRLPKPH